jgi:hypothetical protein
MTLAATKPKEIQTRCLRGVHYPLSVRSRASLGIGVASPTERPKTERLTASATTAYSACGTADIARRHRRQGSAAAQLRVDEYGARLAESEARTTRRRRTARQYEGGLRAHYAIETIQRSRVTVS